MNIAAGILMLSDMLHFVLYECAQPTYPIQKELNFINNYIELEKLRYGKRLKLDKRRKLQLPDFRIAPLLLFPFIENSFKHGASKKKPRVWIKIRITSSSQNLVFKVENNHYLDRSSPRETGGLGMENVQKRLDILYPKQHRLPSAVMNLLFQYILISIKLPNHEY